MFKVIMIKGCDKIGTSFQWRPQMTGVWIRKFRILTEKASFTQFLGKESIARIPEA